MNDQVIAIAGRIGSGKSSVAGALGTRLGAPCVSFGNHVRKVASQLGLDASERLVLQDIGGLLARYPEAFCRKLLEEAQYAAGSPLIVDGVRHHEIVDELRRQVAPARLVLVHVQAGDALLQRRRTEIRGEKGDFRAIEQHSTEVQVGERLLQLADIRVTSSEDRTLDEIVDDVVHALEAYAFHPNRMAQE